MTLPSSAGQIVGSAERAILVVRWIALASIVVNVFLETHETIGRNRPLAIGALLVVTGWTLFLTRSRTPLRGKTLVADVTLGAAFLLVSAMVMPSETLDSGPALMSLTYPFCPVLSAAAAYGPFGGAAAGAVIALCNILARAVNGLVLDQAVIMRMWPSAVGYIVLGLLFGMVANLLRLSSRQVSRATAEAISAREREARLAERDSMAREIHDSVLQVLALIHKRGKELADSGTPSPEQVMELAEMARDQEVALRGLIMREPDHAPTGEESLRTALEAVAYKVRELEVTVSTVGPVWLPGATVEELVAAVREALNNVVEHAGASKVVLFAEEQDCSVSLTVRDNGVGFEFDEARFRAEGKFGVLNSMGGRVEALGGRMRIDSSPGGGTEVEFQVPVEKEVEP